ncbi:c-type cytochrome biogenesis protein CcmI [Stutzerimonas azotifigens]|uniref:c-type cytochrome biogenesis protein CcmI n=1 Tax=Stutzerimonas azotifigens TaxID=291995 RepID=UPI0004201B11|nr:c-type cytochrome biogenesis protein CcmI [Stutzerimonas azotifigens]
MIDLWIGAGLLLLAALAFLLLPLVRGRRSQAEEDRTALNVALYQERLAELDAQRAAGTLSGEQHEAGRVEAARELLEDTEGAEARKGARLGRAVPLLATLLVPAVAFGLYLHWGASDRLQLARQFAEQPRSVEDMIGRLEQAVRAQPESAEGWYFLGRAYMAQERSAEAAKAFERVVELAGRQPELLGQWAQALYFAEGRKWTPQLQTLTEEALRGDPHDSTSLGLLGIAAFEDGRFQEAVDFWERLVATLPQEDPSRQAIRAGIERARAQIDGGAAPAQGQAEAPATELQVRVSLAPEVRAQVQPGDSVFVFARAVSGPPMPLAVKRLSVDQLPATVTLSDADAMMPQLKLSGFDRIRLMARVSREGDAMRGEWLGQSEPLEPSAADGPVELSVDRPE